jgi:drug/metabolite transporter (DMT)-like permease
MTTPIPSRLKIFLIITAVTFFWASALVAIRIALTSYDPGALALFRYAIASFGMVFVYSRASGKHSVPWRDVGVIFLAGILGFGVYNVLLNYGEVSIHAGVAGFIMSQIPVVITLLAVLFLGEKLSPVAYLGMLISFFGVTLIALSHHHNVYGLDIGIIFLLIAVMSAGIYHVIYKHLLHRYHAIELTAYGIWGGTLSLLFYTPALWREIPYATAHATWAVIYLGIFPGLLGYLGWSYVLRYVPASKAASAFYVMPIMTAVLGWLCLGEIPVWLALLGGGIALGGSILLAKAGKVSAKVQVEQA